jgi:undecaprenyl-diphosphatase
VSGGGAGVGVSDGRGSAGGSVGVSGADPDGLDRLDRAIDAAFEPLRGRPEVDRAAAVLSNLADYGLVWVALALLKARRRGAGRRRAVLALAAAGFSSLFVNRAVKAAVARERPEDHLDVAVRAPSSSSFPSGHTLAAFCTAFVLAESDAQTVVNVGFASAVAASRVHLRAHHPSDVVGGAAIGTVLGLGLRPIVNLVAPGRRGRGRGRGSKPAGRVGRQGRRGRRDVLVTQRL